MQPKDFDDQDTTIRVLATREELLDMKQRWHAEHESLKEQIAVLEVRSTSVEAQLAKIEPMVEARNSRTEKLVMDMQVQLNRLAKALATQETNGTVFQQKLETYLQKIITKLDVR